MTDTRLPAEIEAAIRKHAQSRATDDCATCEAQNDPTNDMLRGAAFLFARLSQMSLEFDEEAARAHAEEYAQISSLTFNRPSIEIMASALTEQSRWQFKQTQAQVGLHAEYRKYVEDALLASDAEIERLRADLSEACAARDQWRTTEIENKRLKRELATLKDFFCNAVPNNVYQAALDRAAKERK